MPNIPCRRVYFCAVKNYVPYTGLSIEKVQTRDLFFFQETLKDVCLFCQVCSGDDGHDEILSEL